MGSLASGRLVELSKALGGRRQQWRVQVRILLEEPPEVLAFDHVNRHGRPGNDRRVPGPVEQQCHLTEKGPRPRTAMTSPSRRTSASPSTT